MLHACFVYVPTCFMCTFIQYLAFSGTNLLTRCHSASSYFLLFLCFRKVVQEIFSELHGTKTQVWPHRGWSSHPDSASSPIYSPYRENPGYPRENPRKVLYPLS